MRKHLGAAALTLASAGLAVGLSATSALAATTWSVSPGGPISGKAGTTTVNDTTSGLTVTCTSSALKGSLKSGTGLAGKHLGTVVYKVRGCLGTISNGDAGTISGTYTLTPKQTIKGS